jgi:hypothetical protein
MGNLFYRRQSISDINALTYEELKMWNFWHKKIADEERKATEAAKGKGKK